VVAGEEVYNIHEAYYNSRDEVTALSVDPMYVQGSNLDELIADLGLYLKAVEKPVLDYDMVLADWEIMETKKYVKPRIDI